jgi:hypothetical protein
VIVSQPPYALSSTAFRFPARGALAGRAPLGGQPEVVLATFLAARLAYDAIPGGPLTPALRTERAAGAKTWLSTASLPTAIRPSLAHLIEVSGADRRTVVAALRAVVAATAAMLDARSHAELDQLIALLDRAA